MTTVFVVVVVYFWNKKYVTQSCLTFWLCFFLSDDIMAHFSLGFIWFQIEPNIYILVNETTITFVIKYLWLD